MSNLEVKLEKQDSRTEKKEALFRRMPSLRDLASECSSADVQDVILPSAIVEDCAGMSRLLTLGRSSS